MKTAILITIPILLVGGIGAEVKAKDRQDLRLYRINKDGISDRFWFTRGKAKKPGCHNIVKKSRLHRAVQFGYPACHIYTQKNCATESIVKFTRDDQTEPSATLLEGYSWFAVSDNERGLRVKSWHCGDSLVMSGKKTE